MKVVYIIGRYRGKNACEVQDHIEIARHMAIWVWEAGAAALCPHLNTAHFDGLCNDEAFLQGTMELMRRCDAAVACHNWEESQGSRAEIAECMKLGIPVFYKISELEQWLATKELD